MAIKHAVYCHFCKLHCNFPSRHYSHVLQIIHLIFSWSSFLSWMLFICDIGLIGFLSLKAYRDGKIQDIKYLHIRSS